MYHCVCIKYYAKILQVKVGRGSSRVYVYDTIQMRNHQDHKEMAQKAFSSGKVSVVNW